MTPVRIATLALACSLGAGCGFKSGDYVVVGTVEAKDWDLTMRAHGLHDYDQDRYCPEIDLKMSCVPEENDFVVCVSTAKSVRLVASRDGFSLRFRGPGFVVPNPPISCEYHFALTPS